MENTGFHTTKSNNNGYTNIVVDKKGDQLPPKEFERGDYREFTSSHLPMRRREEHKNIFTITLEILVRSLAENYYQFNK